MIELAGLTEIKVNKPKVNYNDNSKAIGTLFQFNSDEETYEWIGDEYENLRQELNIDEEDWDELHHETSLMDEDEMEMYRDDQGNDDLTPEDITIKMMKQHYLHQID